MISQPKRVLVIAPHADDEVLGCGGIIARLVADGTQIYVAIMTSGNAGDPDLFPIESTNRGRQEAKAAHALLGVEETFFFDFPAPRLDTYPAYKISAALDELLARLKIDTVFVPHRGDLHRDHRIIFEASLVAARPVGNCTVKRILAYETLSETEWAAPYPDDAFIPTFFVELRDEHIEAKINAFRCFTSPRMRSYPHPRSEKAIRSLAQLRGTTIDRPYAESFKVIRDILSS